MVHILFSAEIMYNTFEDVHMKCLFTPAFRTLKYNPVNYVC